MSRFKPGDKVRVIGISYTRKKHGTNRHMVEMYKKNRIIKVKDVSEYTGTVRAAGWSWDEKDLQPVSMKKVKPIKPVMFNVKELDL